MRRICLHLIGVWSGGSNVEDLVAKIALIATILKLHWLHLVDFSMWQIIPPSEMKYLPSTMKQFSLCLFLGTPALLHLTSATQDNRGKSCQLCWQA